MTAQFHRLTKAGSQAPDAFGGVYFSEETGELFVRYVSGSAGQALNARLANLAPIANDVPVRFEATTHSVSYMSSIASTMNNSKGWAGDNASFVLRVWLDAWRYQLRIAVTDHADEIEAAAKAVSGLTPRMSVGKEGWRLL
jgi:hypothetical protein